MIVTTTNSIEGREISRYNDPIAANVVIGTTVFSDIGASYVDFFGGRSISCNKGLGFYSKQLFLVTNYYLSYDC
ncbi:heavy metal-binding domain-containing protein [Sphingobacterium thalpophilum]|uniref:Heavy metal-binding domain-containing protein n=1 Tax=Sphingobacterium thalpophilum TaxID=259 RepID=A0ABV4HLA7_9SPHI